MKKVYFLILCAAFAWTAITVSPCAPADEEISATGPEGGFLVGGDAKYLMDESGRQAPADENQFSVASRQEKALQDPKEKLKEIISVSFKDMDLKEALSVFAENYNLNIIAGDDVKGAISINFNDVPLGDVLTQMLKVKNFTYKWEGNIIYVINAEESVDTRAFFVNHISLDLASEIILDRLSKEGKSKMNTATNQLIVTDTISKLDDISQTLQEIDIPPAQVRIETKLIDVSHTDMDNMGLKWESTALELKLPPEILGENFLGSGNHGEKASITQLDYTNNQGSSTTLTGGQFVFNVAQGSSSVAVTIDALLRNNKAKIIANPSITTINNVEARINIGEKFPIREQTQTSTGTLETTRFVDVGTTLKVTPKINADGTIQLAVHPEVSSVSSTIDAGPRITTREADTTVIVKDGETLIIAGLLQTKDDVNKSRVPFLGALPVIGALFSSRDKENIQKELVIFMTPHILNRADKGAYADISRPLTETEMVADRLGAIEIFNKADDMERGSSLQARVFPSETRLIEAAKLYEQVSLIFPTNYYADIGLARAGSLYEYKLKEYSAALACYMRLVENYPKSAYLGHAKKRIKKLAVRDLKRSAREKNAAKDI